MYSTHISYVLISIFIIFFAFAVARYELGDFDECLKIHVPNQFEPRYW